MNEVREGPTQGKAVGRGTASEKAMREEAGAGQGGVWSRVGGPGTGERKRSERITHRDLKLRPRPRGP